MKIRGAFILLGCCLVGVLAAADPFVEIGKVSVDSRRRVLSIPATVNMQEGTVEYWLVHSTGKVHESVFKTDVSPTQFHAAALLLLPEGALTQRVVKAESAPYEISGCDIAISATWTNKGLAKRVSAEECVFKTDVQKPMTSGPWLYNGSRTLDGAFIAQREGSFVSVMEDLDAIVNNPRPGRGNDDIWQVNTNVVPAVGTPVVIELTFPKPSPAVESKLELKR